MCHCCFLVDLDNMIDCIALLDSQLLPDVVVYIGIFIIGKIVEQRNLCIKKTVVQRKKSEK